MDVTTVASITSDRTITSSEAKGIKGKLTRNI